MEIDHEIISTVIFLPSAESFKKGCCQLQAKYVHEVLVNCLFKPVTYIRVTGHFIFQPYRYVVACVTGLTPGTPFIVHTQNGDAACETASFIGTLKSVLRL